MMIVSRETFLIECPCIECLTLPMCRERFNIFFKDNKDVKKYDKKIVTGVVEGVYLSPLRKNCDIIDEYLVQDINTIIEKVVLLYYFMKNETPKRETLFVYQNPEKNDFQYTSRIIYNEDQKSVGGKKFST